MVDGLRGVRLLQPFYNAWYLQIDGAEQSSRAPLHPAISQPPCCWSI